MNWLEIPPHRVLEVEWSELIDQFDIYDEAGKLCCDSDAYLLFRKKDAKRFKFARFGGLVGATKRSRTYLQEA